MGWRHLFILLVLTNYHVRALRWCDGGQRRPVSERETADSVALTPRRVQGGPNGGCK